MTATLTAPAAQPDAATKWELANLRRAYRPHGWTIWFGKSTGQYWAAHTRAMVLLCGQDGADLAAAINRFAQTARPPVPPVPPVPPQRRPSLPPRPRPRRA